VRGNFWTEATLDIACGFERILERIGTEAIPSAFQTVSSVGSRSSMPSSWPRV
jgi:hypothetical protein